MPNPSVSFKQKDIHSDFNAVVGSAQLPIDSKYKTHNNPLAYFLHQTAERLFYPLRWTTWLLARAIQPTPGAHHGSMWRRIIFRSIGPVVALVLFFPALILSIPALILRAIGHLARPQMRLFQSKAETLPTNDPLDSPDDKNVTNDINDTEDQESKTPLKIWTYNLALVPTFMSILSDLREPKERAEEIAQQVLNVDSSLQPDIIAFQEVFNEDASEELITNLATKYPYVLHSTMPGLSGFNSGQVFVSKYPIVEVEFYEFKNMLFPESIAGRGILKATINTPQGLMHVYNVHLQPFLGKKQADIRVAQLEMLHKILKQDHHKDPSKAQLIVGDFNTSTVSPWGEDINVDTHPEKAVLDLIEEKFTVIKSNLSTTNQSESTDPLEPQGTWVHGPFYEKGAVISKKHEQDQKEFNYPAPKRTENLPPHMSEKPTWGKDGNTSTQTTTAILDHGLFPKNDQNNEPLFKAHRQIIRPHHPHGKASASSDHTAVAFNLFRNKPKTVKTKEQVQKEEKEEMVNAHKTPLAFCIFSGGGPKGAVYPGVVEAMESTGITSDLVGVAGSSAGAITAAFIATSGNAKALKNFTRATDFKKLIGPRISHLSILHDGIPLLKLIQEITMSNIKTGILNMISEPMQQLASIINDKTTDDDDYDYDDDSNKQQLVILCQKFLEDRYKELKDPMQKQNHTHKYQDFLTYFSKDNKLDGNMLAELLLNLLKRTPAENCTFHELYLLSLLNNQFKELHITATTKQGEILHLSHLHPEVSNITIADACRASSSLPGVIVPYKLNINGLGEIEVLDGGLGSNIPMRLFDDREEGRAIALGFTQLERIHRAIHGNPNSEVVPPNLLTKGVDFVVRQSMDDKSFSFRKSIERNMQQLRDQALNVLNLDTGPVDTMDFKRATQLREFLEIYGEVQTLRYLYNHDFLKDYEESENSEYKTSAKHKQRYYPAYDKFLIEEFLVNLCKNIINEYYVQLPVVPTRIPKGYNSNNILEKIQPILDLLEEFKNNNAISASALFELAKPHLQESSVKPALTKLLQQKDHPVRLLDLLPEDFGDKDSFLTNNSLAN